MALLFSEATPYIHLDQNIVLGQDLCGLVLAVGVVGGVLADVDLTGLAGQPNADLIDREVTGSVADGAEDAAPVGVAAKDSGFEEVGADHAAADGAGRLEVGGVGDFAGDEVGRALAVTGVPPIYVYCWWQKLIFSYFSIFILLLSGQILHRKLLLRYFVKQMH